MVGQWLHKMDNKEIAVISLAEGDLIEKDKRTMLKLPDAVMKAK